MVGTTSLKETANAKKLSKLQHIRKGYKFGIRIPTTIEESLMFDAENNNTLW
jgi:hypothetical protein